MQIDTNASRRPAAADIQYVSRQLPHFFGRLYTLAAIQPYFGLHSNGN